MHTFAERDWYYDFREIDSAFSEASCAKVAASLLDRYSKLTKAWSAELNSEWTCRLFMAAKLVMSSTLHVNAAYFAADTNRRVVVPYLRYYSILSLLRAVCYTLPEHEWKNGQLIQIPHGKAIDGVLEYLRCFDKAVADSAETEIRELKAERELISYRAPSSGDDQVSEKNQFLQLCMLLAEVAQFNSELFESSLLTHANRAHFRLLSEYAERIASIEIDGHFFGDREDAYRLGYLARKQPHPVNMLHFMKDSLIRSICCTL
ncbi:MAG TPA: hypothetical protein VMW07_06865 [Gallionella sp.]|jgi:hypothetical protein|nr:hypothetical protein [Gallionella sp.]